MTAVDAPPQEWLTATQAGELLGVDARTVTRWGAAGLVERDRGRPRRFRAADLTALAGRDTLAVGKVASICQVDPKTVARWCTDGTIACTRTPGGHFRVARADAEAMRDRLRPPGDWLPIDVVASRLRASVATAAKWARDGRLPGAVRAGNRWLVPAATVDAILAGKDGEP